MGSATVILPDQLYHLMSVRDNGDTLDAAQRANIENAVLYFNSEFETKYDPNDAFIAYLDRKNQET